MTVLKLHCPNSVKCEIVSKWQLKFRSNINNGGFSQPEPAPTRDVGLSTTSEMSIFFVDQNVDGRRIGIHHHDVSQDEERSFAVDDFGASLRNWTSSS